MLHRHLAGHAVRLLRLSVPARRGDHDACRAMAASAWSVAGAVAVFGPLLEEGFRTRIGSDISWLAEELGAELELRDLEGWLRADLDRLGGPSLWDTAALDRTRQLLERRLARDVATAHARVLAALVSARFHGLADRLAVLVDELPATGEAARPAAGVLPPLVGRAGMRLREAVGRTTEDPATWTGVAAALARWREAAGLAAEAEIALTPTGPETGADEPVPLDADAAAACVEGLEHHRLAIRGAGLLGELARARIAQSTAFCLGVLFARQLARARTARSQFRTLWTSGATTGRGA